MEQGYNIQEHRVFILDTTEDTNCWSRTIFCPQKISGVLVSAGITSNRKTLFIFVGNDIKTHTQNYINHIVEFSVLPPYQQFGDESWDFQYNSEHAH